MARQPGERTRLRWGLRPGSDKVTARQGGWRRLGHHSVILEFDVPSYRTNAAQQRV